MKLQDKVNLILRKLNVRGITPIKVDNATKFTDPAIWITESVYIQISNDYTIVFNIKNNQMSSFECSTVIEDIISALQKAINI